MAALQQAPFFSLWRTKTVQPTVSIDNSFTTAIISFIDTLQDELMLAACRNDQEDTLEEILNDGSCDPNFVDGAGNTAAHYAWVDNTMQHRETHQSNWVSCQCQSRFHWLSRVACQLGWHWPGRQEPTWRRHTVAQGCPIPRWGPSNGSCYGRYSVARRCWPKV